MTTNKIDAINNAVKEWMEEHGRDEQLFALGIELGKHLATVGEEYERLACFIEREQKRDLVAKIRAEQSKVGRTLGKLVIEILKVVIERKGRVNVDASRWGTKIFAEEVGEDFYLQEDRVVH